MTSISGMIARIALPHDRPNLCLTNGIGDAVKVGSRRYFIGYTGIGTVGFPSYSLLAMPSRNGKRRTMYVVLGGLYSRQEEDNTEYLYLIPVHGKRRVIRRIHRDSDVWGDMDDMLTDSKPYPDLSTPEKVHDFFSGFLSGRTGTASEGGD